MSRWYCAWAVVFAAALEGACGGSSMGPMAGGPDGSGRSPAAGAAFMAMSPAAGATAVATSSPVTFRFSAAMGEGMEQYLDLHVDSLSGSVVPMNVKTIP